MRNPWKKRVVVGLSVPVVAFAAWAGYRAWVGYQRILELEKDVLPDFTDAPPGDPAPTSVALSFEVGRTELPELEARLKTWGLSCRDTSVRALMQEAREAKKREIAEAEARGEDVDGITGASLVGYRSKKEQNPQVRLSCEDARSSQLRDRERLSSTGRVLAVFDSPAHPLRHASYRRVHPNHPAALDDVEETLAFYTRLYGPPHQAPDLPVETDGGTVQFKLLRHHKAVWRWPDLQVKVSAMNMGQRGVDVLESVEVPWPVRSDAPRGAQLATKRAPEAIPEGI